MAENQNGSNETTFIDQDLTSVLWNECKDKFMHKSDVQDLINETISKLLNGE